MKYGDTVSTFLIYLLLQVACGFATALWILHAGQFANEETRNWIMPVLFAYVAQFMFSVVLTRSGRSSFLLNFAKSLLAVLMSAAVMLLSSYALFRRIHRVEFQGVDYVAALVIYSLAVPGQLIVTVAAPIALAIRNSALNRHSAAQ